MPDADGLGGKGALSFSKNTSDVRLVERALKERWPIPDSARLILGEEMGNILANPEESSRARSIAARVLLAADQLNLEQEKRDLGGEVVNVNLSGEVKQKHEHDHNCRLAGFLERYDAEVARSAGLPPGVRPGDHEPVDAAGANGQADDLSGNGQH
jgi:hypothetical protein